MIFNIDCQVPRIAAAIFLMALVADAQAHHAAAPHFLLDESITLEGVVTELKLVNPHGYIYFDVADTSGLMTSWRCSLTSRSRMMRWGWTNDTLVPGQMITITGSPARREEALCHFESMVLADGTSIENGKKISEKTNIAVLGSTSADTAGSVAAASVSYRRYLPNGQPNLKGPWHNTPSDKLPGKLGSRKGGGSFARGDAGGREPEPTKAGLLAASGYDVIYDDPALSCHPGNIITAWLGDGEVNDIYQDKNQITLKLGYMDLVRTVHLNQSEHPDEIVPSVEGHSIGSWEDDELVVHTTGFQQGVLFRSTGTMHSDQMRVIERFQVAEDGQTLTRSYTVHDPAFLQSDWVGKSIQQRTDRTLNAYECISLEGANNQRITRQ